METTTYVVQRFRSRDERWVDASEHDAEDDARHRLAAFDENLAHALGTFRLVRRVETVI